ncbi:MAG: ATP-binding protein [Spirochaetes bacterium]|nr:ATP-binding protein [Spirochaetota bacterium]
MERYYTHIADFFFYSTLIELIISLLFLFGRSSRVILLNCLAVILIFASAMKNPGHIVGEPSMMTAIGLFIFPSAFTIMIRHHFNLKKSVMRIIFHLIMLVLFLLYYFLAKYRLPVLFAAYLSLNVYEVIAVQLSKNIFQSRWFQAVLILNIILVSEAIYSGRFFSFTVSAGIMNTSGFMLIALDFRKKISLLINNFNSITEENRRLNHNIGRLKQSTEQCRRIIIDKDMELFQMSRHASLAELTTGIAHELAQPLTGIKGIAQNMIDDINYDEFENLIAVSELIKICSLVDKSTSIINHIRNFSRKNILEKKNVDLNEIILNAVELINIQLKKNDIDLMFALEEGIPKIFGDRVSLEQLILNIVLNSKDAILEKNKNSEQAGGVINITTSSFEGGVRMEIEDSGIGISGENIKKIWSPFFTTKKGSHGTGIGLSISNKIIKEHNATAKVTSGPEGTVFAIFFQEHEEKKT